MTKLKHIWKWVKVLLSRLFRRSRGKVLPVTRGAVPKPAEPAFRQHRVGMFAHHMPKYQPCPFGHGWKRRKDKTLAGARYWCGKCADSFFVRR